MHIGAFSCGARSTSSVKVDSGSPNRARAHTVSTEGLVRYGVSTMECPRCKLINPDTACRCNCGYDFPSATVKVSYLTRADRIRAARSAWNMGTVAAGLAVGLTIRFAALSDKWLLVPLFATITALIIIRASSRREQ